MNLYKRLDPERDSTRWVLDDLDVKCVNPPGEDSFFMNIQELQEEEKGRSKASTSTKALAVSVSNPQYSGKVPVGYDKKGSSITISPVNIY